jgi:hypothetical protein
MGAEFVGSGMVGAAPLKGCLREFVGLAEGDLRTIINRECARALDGSNFRPAYPREVELGLRDLASALEGECVSGVASDLASELLELWR